MNKVIAAFPDYRFVTHHRLGQDEHAVLLEKGGGYAVCKMQPRRMLAMSPNFDATNADGLLTAPLNKAGLNDLLIWSDRATALKRYQSLAGLPGNVVHLWPVRDRPS